MARKLKLTFTPGFVFVIHYFIRSIYQKIENTYFNRLNPDYFGSVLPTYIFLRPLLSKREKDLKNIMYIAVLLLLLRTLFSDKKSVAQIAKDAGESRLRVTQDKDEIPIHSKPVFKFSYEALIIKAQLFNRHFYSQNRICIQKYNFGPKNDGEKWSRKIYF
jgi:hypothetical protein